MSRPDRPYRYTRIHDNFTVHCDYATKEARDKWLAPDVKRTTIVSRTTKPGAVKGHDWQWALKQLHKGLRVKRTNWIVFLNMDEVGRIMVSDAKKPLQFSFAKQHINSVDWTLA